MKFITIGNPPIIYNMAMGGKLGNTPLNTLSGAGSILLCMLLPALLHRFLERAKHLNSTLSGLCSPLFAQPVKPAYTPPSLALSTRGLAYSFS